MAIPKGPNIEARRKKLGLKRSELADQVGLAYQTIYGLERGFNVGSEEKLQLIATALGLDLDDVMDATKQEAA
jgi:transcriptional regulator with XRE-family HTH domain